MKKVSKTLLLVLCAVLLVVGSVMGTLAYLQDTTEVAENTFTSGHVYIDLTEKDWDKDADETDNRTDIVVGETRDLKNEYELIPGRTVDKDPMVTVKADSEEAYVYMTVNVDNLSKLTAILDDSSYYVDNVFLIQNLVTGYDAATWKYVGFENDTYLFVYKETVTTKDGDAKNLEPLFTQVTLPGAEFTNENIDDIKDVTINITAYAIQAEGFDSAEHAWETGFDTYGFTADTVVWP